VGKIIAKGKKYGFEMIIEYELNKVLFNNQEDEVLEDELLALLENPKSIGGTYYPPVDSLLNAMNILQYHFFDKPTDEITVEGEIEEIPFEENKIY
jgi:hypothetical protein